jgi:hypothetical protein
MSSFLIVLGFSLVAVTSFFIINSPTSPLFATDHPIIGQLWPMITAFTWSIGGFPDTEGSNFSFLAYVIFVLYSMFVLVVLMNLLIAIMSDSYQKVKQFEFVEELHGRAKLIVDMELQHPKPFRRGIFGCGKKRDFNYAGYMHIAERKEAEAQYTAESATEVMLAKILRGQEQMLKVQGLSSEQVKGVNSKMAQPVHLQ